MFSFSLKFLALQTNFFELLCCSRKNRLIFFTVLQNHIEYFKWIRVLFFTIIFWRCFFCENFHFWKIFFLRKKTLHAFTEKSLAIGRSCSTDLSRQWPKFRFWLAIFKKEITHFEFFKCIFIFWGFL